MSFTDRFGGGTLTAAQVAYRAVTLTADQATQWPQNATADDVLARIMQVVAPDATWSIFLPDATEASPGCDTFFNNVGTFNIVIKDAAGVTLATLSPGQSKYLYLTDVSTVGGGWDIVNLGTVPSNIDAGALAGAGLQAIGSTLNQSAKVSFFSGSVPVTAADRAKVLLWTGGTGTQTLPLSSSLTDFFYEIRNQGSGTITIATSGGETIDGSASIGLQVGESCFIHAGAGAWYTVGRGRSSQFAFTQLVKTVTGGTVTLTLTEAANVVQTYNGVLVSNVDIVIPPLVQVYYVSNQTSGAFNFRVKTAGAGTTVSIPTGQNAVLFCDGTNVINASTTTAGLSSLVLAAGSAASPSLGVGATNTGVYSAGTGEVSVTSLGTKVAGIDATGLTVPVNGGKVEVNSAAGSANFNLVRPVGSAGSFNLYSGSALRWSLGVDGSTESGSNAGSHFYINRYNDAGAIIGQALSINRGTGLAGFSNGISSAAGGIGSTVTGAATAIQANAQFGVAVNAVSNNSTSGLQVIDNAAGAHLKMYGPGTSTAMFVRIGLTAAMEWVNNGYSIVCASLSQTGVFTAVNVAISSDKRLKSNIRSTLLSSAFRLLRVRGVAYDRAGKPELGVIAQDLDEVYPELVDKSQNFMSVNYMGLIGELVNSQKLLWGAVAILGAIELWRAFA